MGDRRAGALPLVEKAATGRPRVSDRLAFGVIVAIKQP